MNEYKQNEVVVDEFISPSITKQCEEHSNSQQTGDVSMKVSQVQAVKETLSPVSFENYDFSDSVYERLQLGWFKGCKNLFGKRNGPGIFIWENGSEYAGNWENDKMNGYGRKIEANGDYYEGEFCNDKPHGKGKVVYVDGSKCEGQ